MADSATKDTKTRALLGFALLILGAILLFGGRYTTNLSEYTFADEPVEITGFAIGDYDQSKIPAKIIIPSLSISIPISAAENIGGYWEVFEDQAGWGEGSGLPGEPGNQVIFAHAKEGQFLPLRGVDEGMEIIVLTAGNWYRYQVVEISEVWPNETKVIAPTENEQLTLYTCSGFGDSKRLIVIAEPVRENLSTETE
jgi:LPXTG-site transpeptidase (sortase) family protein